MSKKPDVESKRKDVLKMIEEAPEDEINYLHMFMRAPGVLPLLCQEVEFWAKDMRIQFGHCAFGFHIVNMHAVVGSIFSAIVGVSLGCRPGTQEQKNVHEMLNEHLDYPWRVGLVKVLGHITREDAAIANKLNEVRNAFVHRASRDYKRFKINDTFILSIKGMQQFMPKMSKLLANLGRLQRALTRQEEAKKRAAEMGL